MAMQLEKTIFLLTLIAGIVNAYGAWPYANQYQAPCYPYCQAPQNAYQNYYPQMNNNLCQQWPNYCPQYFGDYQQNLFGGYYSPLMQQYAANPYFLPKIPQYNFGQAYTPPILAQQYSFSPYAQNAYQPFANQYYNSNQNQSPQYPAQNYYPNQMYNQPMYQPGDLFPGTNDYSNTYLQQLNNYPAQPIVNPNQHQNYYPKGRPHK